MLNNRNSPYPTAAEIMKTPVDLKQQTIDAVLLWKKSNYTGVWGTFTNSQRTNALIRLVLALNGVYNTRIDVLKSSSSYSYSPSTNEICIDIFHPSIISTLHEYRHAINGPSELSACRWSIWLFKTCFPQEFDQLEFIDGGHLLRKKTPV